MPVCSPVAGRLAPSLAIGAQAHTAGLLEAFKAVAQDSRVETLLDKAGGSGHWFRNSAPQRASQRGCRHRNRSGPRRRARPPKASVSPRRSRPSRSSPRGLETKLLGIGGGAGGGEGALAAARKKPPPMAGAGDRRGSISPGVRP